MSLYQASRDNFENITKLNFWCQDQQYRLNQLPEEVGLVWLASFMADICVVMSTMKAVNSMVKYDLGFFNI